jgi:hypothetical protein
MIIHFSSVTKSRTVFDQGFDPFMGYLLSGGIGFLPSTSPAGR